jgi:hypothetical protein
MLGASARFLRPRRRSRHGKRLDGADKIRAVNVLNKRDDVAAA